MLDSVAVGDARWKQVAGLDNPASRFQAANVDAAFDPSTQLLQQEEGLLVHEAEPAQRRGRSDPMIGHYLSDEA